MSEMPKGEMVERVAKAIYQTDPVGVRDWEGAPASNREDCLVCARAAIEAMREPTGAMWSVGRHAFWMRAELHRNQKTTADADAWADTAPAEIWRIMVYEALK